MSPTLCLISPLHSSSSHSATVQLKCWNIAVQSQNREKKNYQFFFFAVVHGFRKCFRKLESRFVQPLPVRRLKLENRNFGRSHPLNSIVKFVVGSPLPFFSGRRPPKQGSSSYVSSLLLRVSVKLPKLFHSRTCVRSVHHLANFVIFFSLE